MSLPLVITLVVAALFAALAAYTAFQARKIARLYPASGHLIDVDGRQVHVVDMPATAERAIGGGTELPAVVFIHGASGNLHEPMVALSAAFGGRYRLTFFDRPGHGWSERLGRDDASPVVQADILAGLLAARGIERAVVVGHSWGGSVAAAFGVHHPEKTAGLVFLAAATHPWDGGIHWYYRLASRPLVGRLFTHTLTMPVGLSIFGSSIRSVFAPEVPPDDYGGRTRVPLVLRPGNFRANAEDVADLLDYVRELSGRYGDIAAPTEILTGDADGVVYAHIHSTGLQRDIPGARLTVLEGAGHMPHHTRSDDIVAAVDRVVDRYLLGEGR
ncbi:MAG: alpha/beta hydrolase [Hyphomicrobiales bacterium]|nr:MAG: alpha/beta hydrolase [Hyphomicrobiales bacterium]